MFQYIWFSKSLCVSFYRIYTPDGLLLRIFAMSSLALAVPCFTQDVHFSYMAFLVFEVCVGIYFPAMGTMKVCLTLTVKKYPLWGWC